MKTALIAFSLLAAASFSITVRASNFTLTDSKDLPQIEIEGDFEIFKTGLKNEIEHCRQNPSSRQITFGKRTLTAKEWCVKTGQAMLDLASKHKSFSEFWAEAKNTFDWYKSKGGLIDGTDPGIVHFTGFYSPLIEGSRTPTVEFKQPLYKQPSDLVLVNVDGSSRWMRKTGKGYVPYYERKQIDPTDPKKKSVLAGKNLEIVYVKDAFVSSIFQVQGAGAVLVTQPDGTKKRIFLNYSAQNGYKYRSIRGILEQRGVPEEYRTIPGMKKYFNEHPDQMLEILNENPSYVFFSESDTGPYGATSTVMSAGHTIAIDPKFNPQSGIALVRTDKPVFNETSDDPTSWVSFLRMAIANDIGGAIRGAGRVDYFWGEDRFAELAAGHMNQTGELYFAVTKAPAKTKSKSTKSK